MFSFTSLLFKRQSYAGQFNFKKSFQGLLPGRRTVYSLTIFQERLGDDHSAQYRCLLTRETFLLQAEQEAEQLSLLARLSSGRQSQVIDLHLDRCFEAVYFLSQAEQEAGQLNFKKSFQDLLPRPWAIDHFDDLKQAWLSGSPAYNKAVVFVDNSGADIILGVIPLAREMIRHGTRVSATMIGPVFRENV
jgi:hypothetical protein